MLNFAPEIDVQNLQMQKESGLEADILVDSKNFIDRLELEILGAKDLVCVQTMSFEGDAAGKKLIDLLLRSKAKDRRLCIDSYSKAVINDRFIFAPGYLTSSAFRAEVRETKRIVREAIKAGVKVKFTNPLGFLMHKYPLRNHKKMVLIDDHTSFIGGINFTDHNFEWHDFMMVMKDPAINQALLEDFEHTWKGVNLSKVHKLEETELYLFDGYRSKTLYESLFAHLKNAKKSIQILSPYVSNPLLSYIEKNVPEHVEVQVVTPAENNKSIFKDHLLSELRKGYFSLYELPDIMSHLKSILIDGELLIFGSSNFDFASYYFEQEVVIATKNKRIVDEFINGILIPDTENSIKVDPKEIPADTNSSKVKLAEGICRRIGKLAYKRYKIDQNDKKI